MTESASAHGTDPAAGQRPGWFPPGWPQEQVAGPPAGDRDAAPAGGGNAVLAVPVTERCWLCGIRQSTRLLVADGGSACTDLRWYCRDVRSCAGRWTAQRTRRLDSGEPALLP